MARLLGIQSTINAAGVTTTTLHLASNFEDYYNNTDTGRKAVGECVKSVYVGKYDCSGLKIGAEIDISYDSAIITKKGVFQQVKEIKVVKPS